MLISIYQASQLFYFTLEQKGMVFFSFSILFQALEILQYQLLTLLKGEPAKSTKWKTSQNELLQQIVQQALYQHQRHKSNREVELNLKKLFPQKWQTILPQTSKMQREHWFNHLSPAISHQAWSIDEDVFLIEQVNQIGRKWAEISKRLEGHRTEHMLKNRYKSLVKKLQKDNSSFKNEQKLLKLQMSHKLTQIEEEQSLIDQPAKDQENFCLEQQGVKVKEQMAFPVNIQKTPYEEHSHEMMEQFEVKSQTPQSLLVEISQQNFFLEYKKSLGLLSEIDDEIQKYVESFLF